MRHDLARLGAGWVDAGDVRGWARRAGVDDERCVADGLPVAGHVHGALAGGARGHVGDGLGVADDGAAGRGIGAEPHVGQAVGEPRSAHGHGGAGHGVGRLRGGHGERQQGDGRGGEAVAAAAVAAPAGAGALGVVHHRAQGHVVGAADSRYLAAVGAAAVCVEDPAAVPAVAGEVNEPHAEPGRRGHVQAVAPRDVQLAAVRTDEGLLGADRGDDGAGHHGLRFSAMERRATPAYQSSSSTGRTSALSTMM